MLKEIRLSSDFERYDLLWHTVLLDPQRGDIEFQDFKADADSPSVRGLTRESLNFLEKDIRRLGLSPAPTHVNVRCERRVCIEGKRGEYENYTAYSVAYFKEKVEKPAVRE
jgi:hypothetical protein